MSKNKKKPVEEKIKLKFDADEKLDGGDFILKLQDAYSDLISKGCPTTSVRLESEYREYDDEPYTVELIFSGIRERTQEEIEKEEAKKLEERKLIKEMEELRKKLAELKKS